VPADGDNSTPSVGASSLPWRTTFTHGPVFRHVVDLAVAESSLAVLPPGNRGEPGDPHARDMLRLWANHGYVPLHLDWRNVESVKESEETLAPRTR
jgi:acyl-homoserine lactone acylase PvdQ